MRDQHNHNIAGDDHVLLGICGLNFNSSNTLLIRYYSIGASLLSNIDGFLISFTKFPPVGMRTSVYLHYFPDNRSTDFEGSGSIKVILNLSINQNSCVLLGGTDHKGLSGVTFAFNSNHIKCKL